MHQPFEGFPGGSVVKNLLTMEETQDTRFDPCVRKRKKWQLTPVFWPGKTHGQRSLAGYSLWGCRESDKTDCIRMHVQQCESAMCACVLNHFSCV